MYRIRIALLVIALLPILVGLGFWQLERHKAKLAMEELYQSRQQGQFSLADVQAQDDPLYFQLSLTGQFDNARSFLLDNRTLSGRVGFHVLTPFIAQTGETVIIDRGWIAGTPDRRRLPSIPSISGFSSVTGLSWKPAGEAFLLEDDQWSEQWPKVIQAIDEPRMQRALTGSVEPWLLIQDEFQPGSLQRNFHLTNMPASRHFAYAIQWFSMAMALLLLGVWAMMINNKSSNINDAVQSVMEQDKPL